MATAKRKRIKPTPAPKPKTKRKPAGKPRAKAATKETKSAADKQRRNSGETTPPGRLPGGQFGPGNPSAWKPGQSGNPQGRPKRKTLSEAYRALLESEAADGSERTVAEAMAEKMVELLLVDGEVRAAIEMRKATEGERVVGWQDELIALLRAGDLTPEEVQQELGDDAASILIAAGFAGAARGKTESPSQPPPGPTPSGNAPTA